MPPKTHFSIWYFLIAFLLFTYLQQYFLSRKVETISYGQFKQALAEGNVSKLSIGPEIITGMLTGREKKPGQQFTTLLPFVLAAIGGAAGSVRDLVPRTSSSSSGARTPTSSCTTPIAGRRAISQLRSPWSPIGSCNRNWGLISTFDKLELGPDLTNIC